MACNKLGMAMLIVIIKNIPYLKGRSVLATIQAKAIPATRENSTVPET